MSNIERRYAYLDEGVFPEEGEYGVTYLTLYSSNAGNTYDGWVYDPDNKVRESLTERTYGYRNPDYPQYCWDDEVVVDLSNAQSRQESSEYIQGRITSFNTNVSDRPIVLQDIDITGLTEEERENLATTVLFSAIPLVQDAYIQAQVEVQCKCNLSPDNTSGEMRIEAFYILNDESDRTMRPNPVHTFTVSSPNERHTLPWLYWNPALRHDDHNYIGVKLICTGGTAEIGISDNPDYGDAMITLASAGLTGDHIDSGHPVSLEIFGKEEVIGGYELDINDYTVLCTYDTGEIYEVTRMCTFTPEMGTRIEQAFTTLTAHYQGLNASMTVRLGMVESIELMGVDTFHNRLKLKLSDYTVLAYLDTGDVMDVTGECTFSPAMGTTITSNTTLTATYSPFWMHGASFTDSIDIEQLEVVATGYNDSNGLVYTLYEDNNVVITGNSSHMSSTFSSQPVNETITLPRTLEQYVRDSGYTLVWDAEGKVSGYLSIARCSAEHYYPPYLDDYKSLCKGFVNFEGVEITQLAEEDPEGYGTEDPYIYFNFYAERDLTSAMLSWTRNVDNHPISISRNDHTSLNYICFGCKAISNVDFMLNWNFSQIESADNAFKYCLSLKNINGLRNADFSSLTSADYMLAYCTQLETVNGSANWDLRNLIKANAMFQYDESLVIADALWFWRPNRLEQLGAMFGGTGLNSVSFLKNWNKSSWRIIQGMVSRTKIIDLDGLQGLDFTHLDVFAGGYALFTIDECPELLNLNGCEDWVLTSTSQVGFTRNPKLTDISALSEWQYTSALRTLDRFLYNNESLTDISPISNFDVSNVINFSYMLAENPNLEDISPLSGWRTTSAQTMSYMFYHDDKVRYIGCLSGFDVSNIAWQSGGVAGMFARSRADEDNEFANTHIIDADGLHWNVPPDPNRTGDHVSLGNAHNVGVEEYWVVGHTYSCGTANADSFLYGTDLPYARHRSEKRYPIPYWYGGPYEE